MVDTFLLWRDEINHPEPELAIRLAFSRRGVDASRPGDFRSNAVDGLNDSGGR
jgi:hypothetical protein